MTRITILGVRFDLVGFYQASGIVRDWLKAPQKKYHIATPNPEFIIAAQKDDEFKKILQNADLRLADGKGIEFAAKFLGLEAPERIPGTDFMLEMCADLARMNIPIFLLGGENGTARICAEKLKNKYPDLKITGIFEGRAAAAGDKETVSAVNNTDARVVFVAYGAPKQEKWIARNLFKLKNVVVAMGVGGAFDYISGNTDRAPLFMRKMGLEWFWRLFTQPKRIFRIFRAVIVFPLLVLREKLR